MVQSHWVEMVAWKSCNRSAICDGVGGTVGTALLLVSSKYIR